MSDGLISTLAKTGSLLALTGALTLPSAGPASADPATYGELSAAWWQWAEETYPDLDFGKGRVDCRRGQSGHIWFLGGSDGSGPVRRKCRIEKGKQLFFPLVAAADFDDEQSCTTPGLCTVEEHRALLDGIFSEEPPGIFNSVACDLHIDIDESPAVFTTPIVRTQSPPFPFADNSENLSDGFWVLIDPLPTGVHEVHLTGGICDIETDESVFAVDVTYVVRVQ